MSILACTVAMDVLHAFDPMFLTPRDVCGGSIFAGHTFRLPIPGPASIPADQLFPACISTIQESGPVFGTL
jgi:hypothetical protein